MYVVINYFRHEVVASYIYCTHDDDCWLFLREADAFNVYVMLSQTTVADEKNVDEI